LNDYNIIQIIIQSMHDVEQIIRNVGRCKHNMRCDVNISMA
jgi:hypothetical protein